MLVCDFMNYKLLFPIDLKGFLGKQDDSSNSNVLTLRVEGAKAATEEIQAKRVATFIFNLFSKKQKIEIKHGRIAMMAFVGMAVQELGITFPGSLDLAGNYPFADVLKDGMGFAALTNVPLFGLAQIVIFAGFAEIGAMPSSQYTGGPQDLPAGFDGSSGTIPGGYPFTTQIEDPDERDRKLNIEIQNGRGAMLGVFGAMCHSQLDSCDHHFFYPITHN